MRERAFRKGKCSRIKFYAEIETIYKQFALKHIAILEKDPHIFQIRKTGRRHCPLKRFPYLIVNKNIIVYAIFNTINIQAV